jgi:hypothetical protein
MNVEQLVDGVVHHRPTGLHEEPEGISTMRSASSFELARQRPDSTPIYYRIGYGRLEWGTELADFLPGSATPPPPEAGTMLALLQGQAPPPDAAPVPGVRRLTFGSVVRVDGSGVSLTRRPPPLPHDGAGLLEAVAAALPGGGDGYAVAYSGGLGSAFVAAAALAAGHRPQLVHGDLGLPGLRPVPPVPALSVRRVPVDLSDLLDHHWITGAESMPPMPETHARRRLAAKLSEESELPLIGGAFLEDLVCVKLPAVDLGLRSWRLLGCEPFHIVGTLPNLDRARTLLGAGVVYAPGRPGPAGAVPDTQPVGVAPPPSPTGGSRLPWLTGTARQVLETAHRGALAVWEDHLDSLEPVLSRAVAALEERGDTGIIQPALGARVLAAAAAIPPARLGRIRRGRFENHLPLRRAVARAGIVGVREATTGHWLRLAAVDHLHRERRKLAAELERECALADLGLIEPRAVLRSLRDGRDIAENALPLLRLIWLDRWLRGRS